MLERARNPSPDSRYEIFSKAFLESSMTSISFACACSTSSPEERSGQTKSWLMGQSQESAREISRAPSMIIRFCSLLSLADFLSFTIFLTIGFWREEIMCKC